MNKPNSTSVAGTQPIPGYTLRKRLGAGGYGEVWLADAPGGLQKAVKLIYGNVDESRATSELRSLERIRCAHHPFLLSIERIEVVQGKVVIVTELAESSLQDRFECYRLKSLPGIPRSELLDFLRDTADALDFLAQKHSLQHLDVKPGNLLVVADRIKVADFGLVKDLHDSNQSLVGGLTPTYSAPEVFDGRPNFRSDQYSLAIVYMEMLTGRLPFSGKTAGELARQHLNQAPELEPLPPLDRNVVRRALSKNPQDRFSTCRQFVEQLIKVRGSVNLPMDTLDRTTQPNSDSRSHPRSTVDATDWSAEQDKVFQNAISIERTTSKWCNARSLFIGLGGQGVLALRELRRDLLHNVDGRLNCDDDEWLAIDTSCEELEEVTSGGELERIPWESAVTLPIQPPQSYKKFDALQFAPLSRRWLYNIPRSQKTEGVRPIATLSLIAHYPDLLCFIEKRLAKLMEQHTAEQHHQQPLNVYILASLHGGTGASLLAEVGMMVRRAMGNLNCNNYRLSAAVSAATTSNSPLGADLPSANAIVTLAELAHWMDPSRERPQIDYRTGFASSCGCPFDWVTLVDGGLFEDRIARAQNPRNLARVIALDCQTLTSVALADSRGSSRHALPFGWLRTACAATIQDIPEWTPRGVAQWCCLQSLRSTRYFLAGERSMQDSTKETQVPVSSSSLSQMPLTDEACDELTRRLFTELGFAKNIQEIFHCQELTTQWARRVSDDPLARHVQLGLDMATVQSAISRLVHLRIYTWPQTCQIQLKSIEAIQKFSQHEVPDLVRQFTDCLDLLGKPECPLQNIREYLSGLCHACIGALELMRTESKRMVSNLDDWWNALQSDPIAVELSRVERFSLPPQIQHLSDRVKLELERKLNHQLVSLFDPVADNQEINNVPQSNEPKSWTDFDTDDCFQTLRQAVDLVNQHCKELALSPEDFRGGSYHHSVVTTRHAETFIPPLAAGGGQLFRLIVSSEEQLDSIHCAMKNLGILSTTTIVPGTESMGMHLMCDATQLNMVHLVTSLWRPTGATLSLAERLRTRVDIDWDPVSMLLEQPQSSARAAKPDSKVADSMSHSSPGTDLGHGIAPSVDTGITAIVRELPLG